jgi:hypothetical protein
MTETALQAFNRNLADVRELLETIGRHVDDLAAPIALGAHRAAWDDVGDMAHYRDKLRTLVIGARLTSDASEDELGAELDAELDSARARKGGAR